MLTGEEEGIDFQLPLSRIFFRDFFYKKNMGTKKGLAVFSLALDSSSPVAKEKEKI